MTLDQIIKEVELEILTAPEKVDEIIPTSGYISDMLSCVMTGAKSQSLWITLQSHNNIVAVACLLDVAAIIITEGAQPDEETLRKANEEGVTILSTSRNSFYVVGKLWEMGLRD